MNKELEEAGRWVFTTKWGMKTIFNIMFDLLMPVVVIIGLVQFQEHLVALLIGVCWLLRMRKLKKSGCYNGN